jgi:hypothetical protein
MVRGGMIGQQPHDNVSQLERMWPDLIEHCLLSRTERVWIDVPPIRTWCWCAGYGRARIRSRFWLDSRKVWRHKPVSSGTWLRALRRGPDFTDCRTVN